MRGQCLNAMLPVLEDSRSRETDDFTHQVSDDARVTCTSTPQLKDVSYKV